MSAERATKFDAWLRELDEDVIQGDYGYEDGEFTVYPEHWRPMFRERLTPAAAFKRALDAFADARKEDERLRAENWARIQAAEHPAADPSKEDQDVR